jgi:steroid 5-alpha reductase family enzyme
LKFFVLFQFEAVLDLVLAIPFLLIVINPRPELWPIEIIGILIWITGLIGETIADSQLKKFKSAPQNKGKTCDVGLWNYSRHPNYFFEWVMWVGYFVFALGSAWGPISIICPIIMYYFLIHVTGVPAAEAQSLASRGEEYRRYQQSTSMFIPLPKRKI